MSYCIHRICVVATACLRDGMLSEVFEKGSLMSFEMNRRKFTQVSVGSAALMSAFGLNRLSMAQEASPAASPEAVISFTEGPGEDELTIVHAQGETVVKKNPATIISYDVASIQTIEHLGGTLAGVPELSQEDVFESDAETVGSLFEPDYEAVNAMAPDLIIVAGRSAAVYPDLAKIAPTIDVTFGADMLDSFAQITTSIGAILGADEEAATAIAEVEDRVAALKETASGIGTGMIIMTSGGSVTALAPGNARGGRGALIYSVLGIQPPLDDLETATHGEPISFEFLLEHNPDWLFVIDRDNATGGDGQPAQEVLDNEIMHETTAWQNDQVVYLDPFDWYIITGASVPSFNRMLDELDAAFGA